MSIASTTQFGKASQLAGDLEGFVRIAATQEKPLHDVEQRIHQAVQQIGHELMKMFLDLQPDGDLGETITMESGNTLHRSAAPVDRPLQTIFGCFNVNGYVYSRGANRKIELRPVDARLQLPGGYASYLFEEFSQFFCVEQAYSQSREAIDRVFGQNVSVETLQRINGRVGLQVEAWLDELAAPQAHEEGELLVLTADGKGVPLITQDARRVPLFDQELRRGNRRMATLAAVYSVNRFVRTKDDVLAALFRDEPSATSKAGARPKPQARQLTARFARERVLDEQPEMVSGATEAIVWASLRVDDRLQNTQPLICLCDGQRSLWQTIDAVLETDSADRKVEILDLLHVCQYVWDAAKVFHRHREHQEAFVRERMDRLLSGGVTGVIKGLRRMATDRRLRAEKRKAIDRVCRYFEHNASRMQYGEYLRQGYPIATGVIEGACRQLVKDRMERSGMRWSLQGPAGSSVDAACPQHPPIPRPHCLLPATNQHRTAITLHKTPMNPCGSPIIPDHTRCCWLFGIDSTPESRRHCKEWSLSGERLFRTSDTTGGFLCNVIHHPGVMWVGSSSIRDCSIHTLSLGELTMKLQKTRTERRLMAALCCLALLLIQADWACAQSGPDNNDSLAMEVRQANQRADARLQEAVKEWRYKLSMLRNRDRLRSMARDIASAEEKLAQGVELFDSSTTQKRDRMLEAFRRRIVDERTLINDMVNAFGELQTELQKESLALYTQAGVAREVYDRILPLYRVDTAVWETAFQPLLTKARTLSQEDWWRVGTVAAGSAIAAHAQYSRKDDKPQSFGDLLGSLVTELVAEAIVNEVMDPLDDFTSRLNVEFLSAEKVLLEGEKGLVTFMRLLTQLHQAARTQHLLPSMGAK
ncbi:MAG: ISKra4 family transposase [Planctomycetaceae bacterium]